MLHDAWDRHRLDGVLAGLASPADRARIKAMVLGRILFPRSTLSAQVGRTLEKLRLPHLFQRATGWAT